MTSRERVIDLVHQITAARARLQQLEADLDQALHQDGAGPTLLRKAARAPRGSLARRIIQLLEGDPKQAFAVPDVAKRLGVLSVPSLRQTVRRLLAERKIQRRKRGMYGAAQRRAAGTSRARKATTRRRRRRRSASA
jgi:hypothetical protein